MHDTDTSHPQFVAPTTLEGLLNILAEEGDRPAILAGGMTLMPLLNQGIGARDNIVSLGRIPELHTIAYLGNVLQLGATVTHTDIEGDPVVAKHASILAKAAWGIGDVQVRNRGTIGGVVAYGNAGSDYITALTALGAQIRIRSQEGNRVVPTESFFVDLRLADLHADEVITSVELSSAAGIRSAFSRYVRVQGAAPTITAAAVLRPEGGRLAIGGATPTPVLITVNDDTAVGTVVEEVDAGCASRPLGDVHNPPTYRRAMARLYAANILKQARNQRGGQ